MDISELCYELYKVDWMQRVSVNRIMDTYKNCYQDGWDSYDDYLCECGYDGEIYVGYEEFLEAEYLNKIYMCDLLDSEELFEEYLNDIKKIKV